MSKSYHIIGYDSGVNTLFGEIFELEAKKNLDEAEIVIFTGGCDINPALYQESPIVGTYFSDQRDDEEMDAYFEAFAQDKKMIGICRGAQLIHAMQGNKLWQDVDGHGIGGNLHPALDLVTGEYVAVTSCHHQMMRVDEDDTSDLFKVIAIASKSTSREAEREKMTASPGHVFRNDIEVLHYPNLGALCYQGHPEYRRARCLSYFVSLMKRYDFIDKSFELKEIKSEMARRLQGF